MSIEPLNPLPLDPLLLAVRLGRVLGQLSVRDPFAGDLLVLGIILVLRSVLAQELPPLVGYNHPPSNINR